MLYANRHSFFISQKHNTYKYILTNSKYTIDRFKVIADKKMRKMSNVVKKLIRRCVDSRV